MNRSEKIEAILEKAAAEGVDISEMGDSSCTAGYDNDGSTGFEIFENGLDLACWRAGGKPVWYAHVCSTLQAGDGEIVLFFIGEESEIIEKIEKDLRVTKKYEVEDEIEGKDESEARMSVEDFVKEGFRKFETVVVTDDNGAWYFLIKDKKGKEYWMPLRTD